MSDPLLHSTASRLWLLCLALWLPVCATAAESGQRLILSSEGTEFEIRQFTAEGDLLALWIAPRSGFRARHEQVARDLAALGIESWQVDLLDNLFLPRSTANLRSVDAALVAGLIQQAHARSGKQLVLISNGYGAIPVLRGMRDWQLRNTAEKYLLGAVLFSPDTYLKVPSLGLQPEYIAEVSATNLPLMILQSARNGNRWQLPHLIDHLQSGGSPVFFRIMPDATSMFFESDDHPATLEHLQLTASRIQQAAVLMARLPKPQAAAPLQQPPELSAGTGVDIELRPFRAGWSPLPLDLPDANGRQWQVHDYTGKIRVINFWATWCPPCVHEIPSLNNLRERMAGQAFELISINYAQQPHEVKAFLKQVQVDFPVLLDVSGEVAAAWKVIAFPSTFIIDGRGRIRYGVNAAIEWDSEDVLQAVHGLLEEL